MAIAVETTKGTNGKVTTRLDGCQHVIGSGAIGRVGTKTGCSATRIVGTIKEKETLKRTNEQLQQELDATSADLNVL